MMYARFAVIEHGAAGGVVLILLMLLPNFIIFVVAPRILKNYCLIQSLIDVNMGIFKSSVSRMYSDKRSMAVLCKTLATHGDQETLIGKFKEFDTNGSASLDAKEFIAFVKVFMPALPESRIWHMQRIVDPDQSGIVDLEEWTQFVTDGE